MGRPLYINCAHSGCDAMRPKFGSDDGYEFRVFFDVHKSEESGMGTGRMWACCLEHKKTAIRDIIKDINVGLRGYRPANRGELFPSHIQRRGGRRIAGAVPDAPMSIVD